MKSSFTLYYDMDLLSEDIFNAIREQHFSAVYLDKTEFSGENCRCRIDTYQINSFLERGYITVNIYLFQQNSADNCLSVKISAFPPVKRESLKSRKLLAEIEKVISEHQS